MRGKTENDKSIVKKVSCNLLQGKREQKLNMGNTEGGTGKVEYSSKSEMQRLRSPSVISRGPQFAKAINLLPHYTEAQAKGIEEDDEDDQGGMKLFDKNTNSKRGKSENQNQKKGTKGPNFLMPELTHLNRKPNWDYLRQPRKKAEIKYRGSRLKGGGHKDYGVFKQQDTIDYRPFGEERFRQIVAYAIQMKETSHTTADQVYMSHLSDYS